VAEVVNYTFRVIETGLIMKLSRCLSLFTLLVNAQGLAASAVFNASVTAFNEPKLTEISPLHFGSIYDEAGARCTLDSTGTVTGQCVSSDSNVALGVIEISGIVSQQQYQIQVVGSDDGRLRFQPVVSVNDVESVDSDGKQIVSMTTTDTATAISVYGNLEVLSQLASNQRYQANYTVHINFQ